MFLTHTTCSNCPPEECTTHNGAGRQVTSHHPLATGAASGTSTANASPTDHNVAAAAAAAYAAAAAHHGAGGAGAGVAGAGVAGDSGAAAGAAAGGNASAEGARSAHDGGNAGGEQTGFIVGFFFAFTGQKNHNYFGAIMFRSGLG